MAQRSPNNQAYALAVSRHLVVLGWEACLQDIGEWDAIPAVLFPKFAALLYCLLSTYAHRPHVSLRANKALRPNRTCISVQASTLRIVPDSNIARNPT